MDRLNTSQLVWFLNESFTKKISGKSTNDIIKDIPLNISVEEFQSRMKEFFDQKGYGKEIPYDETRGVEVFLFSRLLADEGIFNFYYHIYSEMGNLNFVGVKFGWDSENEVCMELYVTINNIIRFFFHIRSI